MESICIFHCYNLTKFYKLNASTGRGTKFDIFLITFYTFYHRNFSPQKSQFDEEDMGNERMGEKRFFKDNCLLIPK